MRNTKPDRTLCERERKARRGKRSRVVAICAGLLAGSSALAPGQVIAVRAGRVYPVSSAPMDNAVVLIRDGRIEAVGVDVPVPDDAKAIGRPDAVITPGLIDAMCVLDSGVPQSPRDRLSFSCDLCARAHRDHHVRMSLLAPAEPGDCPACRAAHRQHRPVLEPLLRAIAAGRSDPRRTLLAAALRPAEAMAQQGWERGRPAAFHWDVTDTVGLTERTSLTALGVPPRATWAEHASEVTPDQAVIDSVNLLSRDFQRLLRRGVTTVFVSPDSASVIGARGAVVRTGGPLEQRIVRRVGAVKAAMGDDPARRGLANGLPFGGRAGLLTRRPMTRMGTTWVFRKAFYDAARQARGLAVGGADAPGPAAMAVLRKILGGKIALRIQARRQHDILTAIRLAHEFGLKFTLEEATEAYKCIAELRAEGIPVVFGPLFMQAKGFRQASGEARRPHLDTPARLHEAGIPLALTAQELRGEEGLARQAMIAVRYGLPPDAALEAVTASPARILELSDQIGALKPGASADLVLWSGEPFQATSRVLMVMIGGRIAYSR